MYFVFFFQAEDGIRDAQESRGLGDVYKRQASGVVIDSNAKHEFNENFIKAKALIDLYK